MVVLRFIIKLLFPSRVHYFITDKDLSLFDVITDVTGARYINLGKRLFFRSFIKKRFQTC